MNLSIYLYVYDYTIEDHYTISELQKPLIKSNVTLIRAYGVDDKTDIVFLDSTISGLESILPVFRQRMFSPNYLDLYTFSPVTGTTELLFYSLEPTLNIVSMTDVLQIDFQTINLLWMTFLGLSLIIQLSSVLLTKVTVVTTTGTFKEDRGPISHFISVLNRMWALFLPFINQSVTMVSETLSSRAALYAYFIWYLFFSNWLRAFLKSEFAKQEYTKINVAEDMLKYKDWYFYPESDRVLWSEMLLENPELKQISSSYNSGPLTDKFFEKFCKPGKYSSIVKESLIKYKLSYWKSACNRTKPLHLSNRVVKDSITVSLVKKHLPLEVKEIISLCFLDIFERQPYGILRSREKYEVDKQLWKEPISNETAAIDFKSIEAFLAILKYGYILSTVVFLVEAIFGWYRKIRKLNRQIKPKPEINRFSFE